MLCKHEHITELWSSRPIDDGICCEVCEGYSSGKHYGINVCHACACFFKECVRHNLEYKCHAKDPGNCVNGRTRDNSCRSCILEKCYDVGMTVEKVHDERGKCNGLQRHKSKPLNKLFTSRPNMLDLAFKLEEYLRSSDLEICYDVDMTVEKEKVHDERGQRNGSQGHELKPLIKHSPSPPDMLDLAHKLEECLKSPDLLQMLQLPIYPDPEIIRATAAFHIFYNINWIRSVEEFVQMPMPIQLNIVENSFKDILMLSLSYYMGTCYLQKFLSAHTTIDESGYEVILCSLPRQFTIFEDVLDKLYYLALDNYEYDCLRRIVLCRGTNLDCSADMLSMYDRASYELYNHIRKYSDIGRYRKAMDALRLMTMISDFIIEEIFFCKVLGVVSLKSVVSSLYETGV